MRFGDARLARRGGRVPVARIRHRGSPWSAAVVRC